MKGPAMIKLGVNSVLFVGHDLPTAFQHIAWAGYDGIELSAIKGMCEHLDLDNWRSQKAAIQGLAAEHKLALLSMEVASLDEDRLTKAFEAGQGIGVPVINVGPGGKSDVEEDFVRQTDLHRPDGGEGRAVRRDALLQGARRRSPSSTRPRRCARWRRSNPPLRH